MLALGTFAGSANADGAAHIVDTTTTRTAGIIAPRPWSTARAYGSSYYGSPYYYPPPVVYGPGIGINLPGVSIGIGR